MNTPINNPKYYNVTQFSSYMTGWWKDVQAANLDNFPWSGPDDYKPAANARVGTDGNCLFVYMETEETDLRMEQKGFGYVHTDSCMEFFMSPDPLSAKYLNFEFNPAGGMYLAIRTSRHDPELLNMENYRQLFGIKTAISETGWNLEFNIPLSFLRKYLPSANFSPGSVIRGNFYKCGEETKRPHHGCWSPINLEKPDFHCPRFFGSLYL